MICKKHGIEPSLYAVFLVIVVFEFISAIAVLSLKCARHRNGFQSLDFIKKTHFAVNLTAEICLTDIVITEELCACAGLGHFTDLKNIGSVGN